MDTGNDPTTRRSAPTRRAVPPRLAVMWGAMLALSIASAALGLLPAHACRAVLWLIGIGFVLFAVARSRMQPVEAAPSTCAHLLPPPMRRLYWLGYALMAGGVLAATVSAGVVLLG